MQGQFHKGMPEKFDKDKIWEWLSKNDLRIRGLKRCYVLHSNGQSRQNM